MSTPIENIREPGWVIKNINNVARGMLKASIVITIIGLLGLFFSRHKIYNYLCGPFPIELKDYKHAINDGFLHRYYLTVTGDSIIPTDIGEFAQQRNAPKNTSDVASKFSSQRAGFYVFVQGGTRIMAKLGDSESHNGWIKDEKGPFTFTGVMDDIDDDDLLRLMRKYETELYKNTDMYLLDTKNPSSLTIITWALLIIFGAITLLGIIDMAKNMHRVANPLKTKYARGLTFYGEVETIATEIEKEYSKGIEKWERMTYTENWVLFGEIPEEEYPLGKRKDFKEVIVSREKASKNSDTKIKYVLKFATGLEEEFSNTKTSEIDINLILVGFKRINPALEIKRR